MTTCVTWGSSLEALQLETLRVRGVPLAGPQGARGLLYNDLEMRWNKKETGGVGGTGARRRGLSEIQHQKSPEIFVLDRVSLSSARHPEEGLGSTPHGGEHGPLPLPSQSSTLMVTARPYRAVTMTMTVTSTRQ